MNIANAAFAAVCKERDEAREQLDRICRDGFGYQDTIGGEACADYVLRKLKVERELARDLRDALELYGLPYTDADLDTLAESTTGTGEINPTTAKREVIRRYALTKAKEVLP